jgi:hypothetical protein
MTQQVRSWALPTEVSGPETIVRVSRSAPTGPVPVVRAPRRRWRHWHTVVLTAAGTVALQALVFVALAVVYFPAPAALVVQAHTGLG